MLLFRKSRLQFQPLPFVKHKEVFDVKFSRQLTLIKSYWAISQISWLTNTDISGTEMIPKMSLILNQMTWLI